jgi:hypothetical protein
MIERINKNEERFDRILKSVKELEEALNNFGKIGKDLSLLKKYYGSKNWFKDKEAYESNKMPKVKAGVLSEDGIWNMLSDIDELVDLMNTIVNDYNN